MSWTETRWTPSEVALLLASRRENIGQHGVPMDQALDPKNKGKFVVDATLDLAAYAVASQREAFRKDYSHQPSEYLESLIFTARLAEGSPTGE